MTVNAFMERCDVSKKTVKKWIKKGYVPGAELERDYVPDSAKPPYTGARAKNKRSASVFNSIIKATLRGKHVLPELYKMCPEEFESYIGQLVEAGLIRVRITDGITYYDPTLRAEQKNKEAIRTLIKECVEAVSESVSKGVTSAYLEMANARG